MKFLNLSDENLLSVFDQIVTKDETCVHHYNSEYRGSCSGINKMQSSKEVQSHFIGRKTHDHSILEIEENFTDQVYKKIKG